MLLDQSNTRILFIFQQPMIYSDPVIAVTQDSSVKSTTETEQMGRITITFRLSHTSMRRNPLSVEHVPVSPFDA